MESMSVCLFVINSKTTKLIFIRFLPNYKVILENGLGVKHLLPGSCPEIYVWGKIVFMVRFAWIFGKC